MNENNTRQNLPMTESETSQNPSMNGNDSPKIVELLEGQVQDLKERLEKADGEKDRLLELAKSLQNRTSSSCSPAPAKNRASGDTSA